MRVNRLTSVNCGKRTVGLHFPLSAARGAVQMRSARLHATLTAASGAFIKQSVKPAGAFGMVNDHALFLLPRKIIVPEALAYPPVYLLPRKGARLIRRNDTAHVRLDIAALVYFVPLRAGDKVTVYCQSHHRHPEHTNERTQRIGQI